jgi:hypothetical protein
MDVMERVDKRLETLRPRVKGFSHYVQLLVDWDLNEQKRQRPFNQGDYQFSAIAE